ncbi:myocardin-related transcription factor A-like isoform X2 [Melanotaenia boesemani]|uniref:myocardin-related transcription factor A-like isoform X2 n=1 Tax=Melanotaenia boesemani TaxID=1250792 RepID=UPI001C056183|nr:myocardin-related transcription factor A-like isoform X2 [Melanotaenia boesemani]
MPALKGSAALPEQKRGLEREQTEDYLKRKIKRRPERTELIRMHIFEETSAEPSPQAKQLLLKRARLADDLNEKIACRPGPMELIHKNILPVHSSIKQAIVGTQFPEASEMNSSCDEDSDDSLSPGQPISQDYPLGPGAMHSPTGKLTGSSAPSPTQAHPTALPFPIISESFTSLKLTNGNMASSVQRTGVNSDIKSQPKPNSECFSQRHKKTKDNKPKIKKLKYHQYIPPDRKGDKEPPPHLDSSYAKILQQQQHFLQLQILSQQQQHFNYHTILPATLKNQIPTSSFCSTSSSPPPAAAEEATPCGGSAPLGGTKASSAHPNLDGMKVAELKCELKLRSLPVSGTKNDLIERLRTYQELNQGINTTSSPTAWGTTGPGHGGLGRSFKTTETTNTTNSTSQEQQSQHHQASSLSADASSSFCPPAVTPKQLKRCGGNIHSLTPRSSSPAGLSPKDISFNSDPLRELMSSPLPELSLQPSPVAQLPANIKEEPPCSIPAPCQFSLKSPSLKKHCFVSSAALTTTAATPLVTIDKDRMLLEKDKQIAELTRMLRQKQRLVEMLKMQLEHENREATVPEPLILLGVKEEPRDQQPFSPQISSISSEMNIAEVKIKQEALETEISRSEASVQSSDTCGLYQSPTQTQQMHLQLKPEQNSKQKTKERICLQQTGLHLAQRKAIQNVLLQQQQQQQQTVQNQIQRPGPQQKQSNLCKQRQKKKLHLQQHEQQKKLQPSQQQHQQLKKLKSVALPQQTKQLQQIQIQTKLHLKQQQKLPHEKQEGQQIRQTSQTNLSQQSVSTPSLSLHLLKSDPTPTLVSDSNGNHFLISLTNHRTGNNSAATSKGKETNHIVLQRLQSTPAKFPGPLSVQVTGSRTNQHMHLGVLKQLSTKTQSEALQKSAQQPQQGAVCLSAPPSLQPFFKDQGSTPTGKNASSPSTQTEMYPGLDILLSPLSPPAAAKTAAPPNDKDTENADDFIDIILQAGEMSTTFRPTPDPSLDCLNLYSSSPPPSPLHMLLSPPNPLICNPPQPTLSLQPEPQAPADTTEEKQLLHLSANGRLEDFLESTTGKPLLGVEPGGLLSLIDDLHSQLLCTPSILDHPLSPMDTIDIVGEGGQRLVSTDWSDTTMGEERDEEAPTLAPLGPQTPLSVFSTDFLDSSDLHIHWGSCL